MAIRSRHIVLSLFFCCVTFFAKTQPHFVIGFHSAAFPGKNSVTALGFLLGGQLDITNKDLFRVNASYDFGKGKNFAYTLEDPDHVLPDSAIVSNYSFMHLSWNMMYHRFITGDVEEGGWYGAAGIDLYMFSIKVKNIRKEYAGPSKNLDAVYIPGAFRLGAGRYFALGEVGFFTELLLAIPIAARKFSYTHLPFRNPAVSLTIGFVAPPRKRY